MISAPGQTAQLEIFAWGSTGPTGAALYTSSAFSRINAVQDFTASGINLTLTQGSLYGAVITNAGYYSFDTAFNTNQNSYTGGEMWLLSQSTPTVWNNYPTDNLLFQATFVSAAAPPTQSNAVPEPGAFLLMGVGLIGLALLRGVAGGKQRARERF